LSCIIFPFTPYKHQFKVKPAKFQPLTTYLAKESLKFPHDESDIVQLNCEIVQSIQRLREKLLKGGDIRVELAKSIRSLGNWGKTWEVSFVIALASEINQEKLEGIDDIIAGYKKLYQYIFDNKLQNVYEKEYILNGQEIGQLFGVKGPAIKLVKENVFYW
jgi:hypothetical protein